MKKFYLLIVFVFQCISSFSQGSDSVGIGSFFKQLKETVYSNNAEKFSDLSMPRIYCQVCLEIEDEEAAEAAETEEINVSQSPHHADFFHPVQDFIADHFTNVFSSETLTSLKENEMESIDIRSLGHHTTHKENYPLIGKEFLLYEIVFEREDGLTMIFQIAKTKAGFRFYGYESVL